MKNKKETKYKWTYIPRAFISVINFFFPRWFHPFPLFYSLSCSRTSWIWSLFIQRVLSMLLKFELKRYEKTKLMISIFFLSFPFSTCMRRRACVRKRRNKRKEQKKLMFTGKLCRFILLNFLFLSINSSIFFVLLFLLFFLLFDALQIFFLLQM